MMERKMFSKITGYVYFVQIQDTGPIKIGFTNDVKRRVIEHQASIPYELKLLYFFPGCKEDEKTLHHICQKDHIRGEWFWPSKHVFDEIEQQKTISKKTNWLPETADPASDFVDRRLAMGI